MSGEKRKRPGATARTVRSQISAGIDLSSASGSNRSYAPARPSPLSGQPPKPPSQPPSSPSSTLTSAPKATFTPSKPANPQPLEKEHSQYPGYADNNPRVDPSFLHPPLATVSILSELDIKQLVNTQREKRAELHRKEGEEARKKALEKMQGKGKTEKEKEAEEKKKREEEKKAEEKAEAERNSCPICKSSVYINPKIVFMVNPECYHRLCTSCIDRIFANGPNTCPHAGCGKYLRKNRFKIPRFEDLAIERECDIRARVAKVLNHSEADFESLAAYNDYEEWKEDVIQDLVNHKDVEKHEKMLSSYAKDHSEHIAANAALEAAEKEGVAQNERLRKERSELARAEALKERQEELAEREAGRREVVNKIMRASDDVLKVAKEAERAVQRRAAARAGATEASAAARTNTLLKSSQRKQDAPTTAAAPAKATQAAATDSASADTPTVSYRPPGLKKRAPLHQPAARKVEDAGPYDPFAGLEISFQYYTLQESGYHHAWSQGVDDDPKQAVPGLRAMDYQRRAQLEAHAGLGVFIGMEKDGQ